MTNDQILEGVIKTNLESTVKTNWTKGLYEKCSVCDEMYSLDEMESVLIGDDDHSENALVCYHCFANPDKYVDERGEALEDITRENCKSIII